MIDIRTLFVTFYSYKGGVGRTLALANMAWQAAKEGNKVVIIDFDLEAPGISGVIPFREPVKKHLAHKEKFGGMFEAILEYQKDETLPSLEYYATDPIIKEDFKPGGMIYIIPAGLVDENYCKKLQSFDWDKYYTEEGGRDFFHYLRETIEVDFEKPDLVLIDSRTGLTDIGGICTLLLPDRVVMMTGLNYQNLQGTRSIIENVQDNAEKRKKNHNLEPIDIITVASHIPDNQEKDLTRKRLREAKEVLGRPILEALPYTPILSLEERVLLADFQEDDLGEGIERSYLRLYDRVTEPYTEKLRAIKTETEKFFELQFNYSKTEEIGLGERLIKSYKEEGIEDGDLGDILIEIGAFLGEHEKYDAALNYFRQAEQLLEKQISFNQNSNDLVYQFIGQIFLILSDRQKNNEQQLLNEAKINLQKALQLNPARGSNYRNYAEYQLKHYHVKKDKTLLHKVIELSHKALNINPDVSVYNLACAHALLGEKDQALEYLKKAINKKEITIEHIFKDEDLASLRDDPAFKKLTTASSE